MVKLTLEIDKKLLTILGFLLLLTLIIYLPALSGPLVFDDHPALTTNPAVQIGGTIFDEWRTAALSSESGPLRRPISMATFAANHAAAGGFKLEQLKAVNLFIHLLCGAVLFQLSHFILAALGYNLKSGRAVALGAAAIWLLHPLHVTTVLYTVQRMAQLSTLAVLVGLMLFSRYRLRWLERGPATGELPAAALWLSLITYIGVYCKENVALLLWLIPVLEITVFRGRWRGVSQPRLQIISWVAALTPLVLVGALFLFSYDFLVSSYAERNFTLEQRLLSQSRILWQYLSWLVLPDVGSMGFLHDDLILSRSLFSPLTTALAIISWLMILVAAWAARERSPLLLLGLLVFIVGHSIESGFLALEMVYEHRNYLPSIGVCLGLSALLYWLGDQAKVLSSNVPLLIFVLSLAGLTALRVQPWTSELALSTAMVDNHPESARSHYNLAYAITRALQHEGSSDIRAETREELETMAEEHFREYAVLESSPSGLINLYVFASRQKQDYPERLLDKLPQSIEGHRLQASDFNVTILLFECLQRKECSLPGERVEAVFDLMLRQNPNSVTLLVQKYRSLKLNDEPAARLLYILDRARQLQPGNYSVNGFYLQELAEQAKLAQAFEMLVDWLRIDVKRRDLARIKRTLAFDTISAE